MMLPQFDYLAPKSLTEACTLMAEGGQEACLLAGGTDLLVNMKRGGPEPRLLVSLSRVPDLDVLEPTDGGGLRVGPMAIMSRIASSAAATGPWLGLAEGAAAVAGPVIRNRATVGGNVVNARPCADTVPPLMALGARLHLVHVGGMRVMELEDFITGPGQTQIEPGEILSRIDLPPPGGPTGSCYLKLTRRAAMEVTIVGCAAAVVLDEECGRVRRAQVVLTSVAPVLLAVPEAGELLQDRALDRAAIKQAAAAARRAATPIDDHRAPAAYRSEMVEVLARRALSMAVDRAGGELA
jgi:carbon-monoxide dehydrogenase medium subunit